MALSLTVALAAVDIYITNKDLKESNFSITKLQDKLKVEQDKVKVEQGINEALYQENKILTNEVALRQDITSLIVDAARSYNLDPKLLAKVIKSESNFRPNPKHALPHVVGPAGINTKAWKTTLHNPNSYVGNIYAGAEILSHYIEDSDNLTLALTRYKGLSPLGLSQAKQIIKEME
jgi:soluble lytic murein transglycosylase-like protein